MDTWAATAAGAYTLTENSLYTKEAFDDYLDHLSDRGVLTITRWVFDGLRLVSLAQEACAQRGWIAADRLAIVRTTGSRPSCSRRRRSRRPKWRRCGSIARRSASRCSTRRAAAARPRRRAGRNERTGTRATITRG